MALIKLVPTSRKILKRITFDTDFDTWNLLMASGEPRAVMERILAAWCQSELDKKDVYVVSTNDRIRYVDFGVVANEEKLIVLREQYAREVAQGKHQKATGTKLKITEVERDMLLTRQDWLDRGVDLAKESEEN